MIRTALSAALVTAFLLIETWRSRMHERALRARGAIEPAGDVYAWMQFAYPVALLSPFGAAMLTGPARPDVWVAGLSLFLSAKALKFWAIRALGPRWTFRLLVLPGEPLVTSGPYRYLRHPNYVAVVGEIAGAATMCAAPVAGALLVIGFAWLIRRRIAVEDRALRSSTSPPI